MDILVVKTEKVHWHFSDMMWEENVSYSEK